MIAARLFSETYLRRLENLALVFRRLAATQTQGERRSSRRGHSVEFADFRPYTLGDDFRRIDWNAYARLEKLFVKLFVEEQEITINLLVDNSPSMDWGEPTKLEYAIRTAASLGYIGLVNLDCVRAQTMYSSRRRVSILKPVRGKRSALTLFNYLQSIEPAEPEGLTENSIIDPLKQDHGIVFVFSDLFGDHWQNLINRLCSQGNAVALIHLLSPDEIEPTLSGDFRLIDRENQAEVEVTADFETLRQYQRIFTAWQSQWQQYCSARDVAYIPVTTTTAIEELMFSKLPTQGVLI